jgi:hypothetical protein
LLIRTVSSKCMNKEGNIIISSFFREKPLYEVRLTSARRRAHVFSLFSGVAPKFSALFMAYLRVCSTTGVTTEAGTAAPCGTPLFIPALVVYVVLCRSYVVLSVDLWLLNTFKFFLHTRLWLFLLNTNNHWMSTKKKFSYQDNKLRCIILLVGFTEVVRNIQKV